MKLLPDGKPTQNCGEPFRGYKRTWSYARPKAKATARTDEERLVALRDWLVRHVADCRTVCEREVVLGLLADDAAALEVL